MERNLTKELKDLDKSIRASLNKTVKHPKKISFTEMTIMKLIFMSDKPIYQKDIVEATKLNKSSIAEQLDRMESRNLIKRIPDKNDKRKNQIVLTEKVLNKKEELDSGLQDINKELVKNISKKELASFYEVLDKMKRNIDKK